VGGNEGVASVPVVASAVTQGGARGKQPPQQQDSRDVQMQATTPFRWTAPTHTLTTRMCDTSRRSQERNVRVHQGVGW
jgi:hypothetical protein